MSDKPPRIIMRPFMPRKYPYTFTPEGFDSFITIIFPKIQSVLYAGWGRRNDITGKKRIGFFLATGKTSYEARKNYKESKEFGENVWEIPH